MSAPRTSSFLTKERLRSPPLFRGPTSPTPTLRLPTTSPPKKSRTCGPGSGRATFPTRTANSLRLACRCCPLEFYRKTRTSMTGATWPLTCLKQPSEWTFGSPVRNTLRIWGLLWRICATSEFLGGGMYRNFGNGWKYTEPRLEHTNFRVTKLLCLTNF